MCTGWGKYCFANNSRITEKLGEIGGLMNKYRLSRNALIALKTGVGLIKSLVMIRVCYQDGKESGSLGRRISSRLTEQSLGVLLANITRGNHHHRDD